MTSSHRPSTGIFGTALAVLPLWDPESAVASPVTGIRMMALAEVLACVGLRATALYERIAAGTFPAPAPLTGQARRWAAFEVAHSLDERTARSLREAKERTRVIPAGAGCTPGDTLCWRRMIGIPAHCSVCAVTRNTAGAASAGVIRCRRRR